MLAVKDQVAGSLDPFFRRRVELQGEGGEAVGHLEVAVHVGRVVSLFGGGSATDKQDAGLVRRCTHIAVAVEGSGDGVGKPVESEGFEDRVERRIVVRPHEELLADPARR